RREPVGFGVNRAAGAGLAGLTRLEAMLRRNLQLGRNLLGVHRGMPDTQHQLERLRLRLGEFARFHSRVSNGGKESGCVAEQSTNAAAAASTVESSMRRAARSARHPLRRAGAMSADALAARSVHCDGLRKCPRSR